MFKLEQLSEIKAGDLIELEYTAHLIGISPEKLSAKFISNNPAEKYLVIRRNYYDPVPALGAEWKVNYDRILNIKKRVWSGMPG